MLSVTMIVFARIILRYQHFDYFYFQQKYTDATLACEGKFYSVHKLVLSTCSDYFSDMFERLDNKNPIIVLKDIKCADLEALLDYMYLGEVNVKQSELSSLIKSAECLQIKGLAVPDDEPTKKTKKPEPLNSPSPKRQKIEDDAPKRNDANNKDSEKSIPSSSNNDTVANCDVPTVPQVKLEVPDQMSGDENQDILDVANDCFNESNEKFKDIDEDEENNICGNDISDIMPPSSTSFQFDSSSVSSK